MFHALFPTFAAGLAYKICMQQATLRFDLWCWKLERISSTMVNWQILLKISLNRTGKNIIKQKDCMNSKTYISFCGGEFWHYCALCHPCAIHIFLGHAVSFLRISSLPRPSWQCAPRWESFTRNHARFRGSSPTFSWHALAKFTPMTGHGSQKNTMVKSCQIPCTTIWYVYIYTYNIYWSPKQS